MTERAHRPGIERQITWVYTADLDGTCAFYAVSLGLEEVQDQGDCRIYRAAANAFLGVCRSRADRKVEPEGVVISLVTREVDAWYRRLEGAGLALEGPPSLRPASQVYSFFVRDPNGYRIEFQTSPDGT